MKKEGTAGHACLFRARCAVTRCGNQPSASPPVNIREIRVLHRIDLAVSGMGHKLPKNGAKTAPNGRLAARFGGVV